MKSNIIQQICSSEEDDFSDHLSCSSHEDVSVGELQEMQPARLKKKIAKRQRGDKVVMPLKFRRGHDVDLGQDVDIMSDLKS